MRKDRLLIKGKPTGTAKDEIVLQHLINKHSGKPIPYFIDEKDGRLKYLDKKTTDKKTGVITYGYNDLTKKLEREARYQAEKLKLTPDLKRFQKAFGKVKGQQIFLDELAKNDAIFTANNPDLYDIDHMGSKKFKYPHMARNFNPQLSAANRAEGARLLTKEQETALRVLRNDLDNTIKLQGPELTQVQKDQVLGRDKGGTTKDLIKQELTIKKGFPAQTKGGLEAKRRFKEKEKLKYSDYPEWQKGEVVINNPVNGTNGTNVARKNALKLLGKNVKRIPKPLKKAGLIGLAGVPILGAGLDVNAAQHDIRKAIKDPSGLHIRNAVGSTIEAVDQFTPGVGAYINAAIRSKSNKNMSTDERKKAVERLKIVK